jgi:hypothetical protein
MRPTLYSELLQREVLQSPIRIKVMSFAVWQVGYYPWPRSGPIK